MENTTKEAICESSPQAESHYRQKIKFELLNLSDISWLYILHSLISDYSINHTNEAPVEFNPYDFKDMFSCNSPKESHENWCKVRKEQGWVYGDTKNVETKTSPCLLPYENLPESQRIKDTLAHCIIRLNKWHGGSGTDAPNPAEPKGNMKEYILYNDSLIILENDTIVDRINLGDADNPRLTLHDNSIYLKLCTANHNLTLTILASEVEGSLTAFHFKLCKIFEKYANKKKGKSK